MELQKAKEIIDRNRQVLLKMRIFENFDDIKKAYDISSESIDYRIGKSIKQRMCMYCDKEDCSNCNDDFNRCPNCNVILDDDVSSEPKYCPECGQALRWYTEDVERKYMWTMNELLEMETPFLSMADITEADWQALDFELEKYDRSNQSYDLNKCKVLAFVLQQIHYNKICLNNVPSYIRNGKQFQQLVSVKDYRGV